MQWMSLMGHIVFAVTITADRLVTNSYTSITIAYIPQDQ
jgi:hypothetical protein